MEEEEEEEEETETRSLTAESDVRGDVINPAKRLGKRKLILTWCLRSSRSSIRSRTTAMHHGRRRRCNQRGTRLRGHEGKRA